MTKIGFRRHVQFFLAGLVGFLIVLILMLVVLLQSFAIRAEQAIRGQWIRVAKIGASTLNDSSPSIDSSKLEAELAFLRTRYAIDGIEVARPGTRPVSSGYTKRSAGVMTIDHLTSLGRVSFFFEASELSAIRRQFLITATICFVSTCLGTMLLLFYLPKIVRPVEEMLDHARQLGGRESGDEESSYLIETFKRSIATMKRQEDELKHLHDVEKTRADDLQRITATLTRSLTTGFIAVDREGLIVDINSAAREILGLTDPDASGGTPLAAGLGSHPFAKVLEGALMGRLALTRHEVTQVADGQSSVIGLTTVPIHDEADQFLGMLALFTDLTPIRNLEHRVSEMKTLADLGEISAGIAHEFRNSLSTILGYLKLAKRGETAGIVSERVGKAEEEATLLSAAVEGLLAFARPMRLKRQQIDLGELVESVAGRLDLQNHDTIHLAIERSEPVLIQGDPALLSRAIENLLRNSIDAIEQKGSGGTIAASIENGNFPTVTIEDDGIGLEESDAARLLLPFQSDKPNGFGLGLALARKIVVLHHGTLRLGGTPGVGARVQLVFSGEDSGGGE